MATPGQRLPPPTPFICKLSVSRKRRVKSFLFQQYQWEYHLLNIIPLTFLLSSHCWNAFRHILSHISLTSLVVIDIRHSPEASFFRFSTSSLSLSWARPELFSPLLLNDTNSVVISYHYILHRQTLPHKQ